MSEWQPVETAPKIELDERGRPHPCGPMLLLASEAAHIAVGYWRKDEGREGGWYNPHDHRRMEYWNVFTHWMPIPALPKRPVP